MKSPTLYYLCDIAPVLLKFKLTDLQRIYFGKKMSRDSALTSPSNFHNCLRFSVVPSGIRLCLTKKNLKKLIAKTKEQDTISSLLESLGKEYHVFSHLCRSFVDCSGSKLKGGGTPGILFQNTVLYSTSKKSFSEILHPYSCFPLQG